MSIVVNDSMQSNSPKSLDNKYLKNGVIAYADVNDANTTINSAYRSKGLTVLIANKEYWYRDGILDANLIPKDITSASAPLVIDAGTNNLSIIQASTGSSGYLGSGDWNVFNNKLGSVATANSIMNNGTVGSPIQLVNDSSTPGNNKYYGTDGSGVRGFFSLSAGTGTVTSVALTVPSGLSIGGSPVTSSGTLAITTSLNGPVRGNGSGFTTGSIVLTSEVIGTLPLINGGTGQTTANAAFNALAPTQTSNSGKFLTTDGTNTSWATVSSGSGTVTTFSSGSLSPLFTTSVTNATTTPALSFSLTNAGANTVLGNNTGSSAAPTYFSPTLASSLFNNQGTTTTVLHGNASGNPSWGAINLANDVTGTLSITNGGTGTSTPALVAGTNVTITGTWPNQTINSSASGSIIEEPLGIIYNQTTWSSLTDFTVNGATVSTSSGDILVSGGNDTTYTNTLDINGGTLLEKFVMKVTMDVGTLSGSTSGIGIGMRSVNPIGPSMMVGKIDLTNTGTNGTIRILGDIAATVLAASGASNPAVSSNDIIELILERDVDMAYFSVMNRTTGTQYEKISYQYKFDTGNPVLPNTGTFSIFAFGASVSIKEITVSSRVPKNAALMIIGDSKTQGYYADTTDSRYGQILDNYYHSTIISAGGADRTIEAIYRVNELVALAPRKVIMAIGRNDDCTGVSAAIWQANYDSIVSQLTTAGAEVWHMIIPETSCDISDYKNYVYTTYPTKIIPIYDILNGTDGYLSVDNIHPSQYGNEVIASAIINSFDIDGQTSAYRTNHDGFILNQTSYVQDAGFKVSTPSIVEKVHLGKFSSLPDFQLSAGLGTDASSNGEFYLRATTGATDTKLWDTYVDANTLYSRVVNDTNTGASDYFRVTRSGTTIGTVQYPAGRLLIGAPTDDTINKVQVNGNVLANDTLLGLFSVTNGFSHVAGFGTGDLSNGQYYLRSIGAATDTKLWDVYVDATSWNQRTINDANSASSTWFKATRTGTTINTVEYPSGRVLIGGATDDTSTKLQINGSAYFDNGTVQIGAILSTTKVFGAGRDANSWPYLYWKNLGGATDTKLWDWYFDASGNSVFRAINDTNSGASNVWEINRSGTTINTVKFPNGNFTIGSLDTDLTAPTTSGTTKMVICDSNGLLSFDNIPSGGGSPAGSDTQIQYNNSGSFGASSLFVVDTTNKRITTTSSSGADIGFRVVNTGIGATDTAAVKLENSVTSATLFITTAASSLASSTGFFTGSANGFVIYPNAKQAARFFDTKSYFYGDGDAGVVGIGVSSPTAKLHLMAGTATANTAPLKINSGTNLTTPEDGAMEYNGTHLYFTIGSTRYQLDQTDTTIYTIDGTLSANRTMNANSHSFDIIGASSISYFASSLIHLQAAVVEIQGTPTHTTQFALDSGSGTTLVLGNNYVILNSLTADRTITLPTPTLNGATITLFNKNNTTFNWTFASTVTDQNENTVTQIPDASIVILTWNSTNGWVMGNPNNIVISNTSAGTLTLKLQSSRYSFTGTTSTWTLPTITNTRGITYYIKNRGSGNITLNSNAGGNDIYTTSAVNTTTISAGAAAVIENDGTYWIVK